MVVQFATVGPTARIKIRIIQGVVLDGMPRDIGEVLEVSAPDALLALSMHRAERFVEGPSKPIERPVEDALAALNGGAEPKKKGDKK